MAPLHGQSLLCFLKSLVLMFLKLNDNNIHQAPVQKRLSRRGRQVAGKGTIRMYIGRVPITKRGIKKRNKLEMSKLHSPSVASVVVCSTVPRTTAGLWGRRRMVITIVDGLRCCRGDVIVITLLPRIVVCAMIRPCKGSTMSRDPCTRRVLRVVVIR